MRRVLLLVTDLQPGGTPLRIVRTARALGRLGFEPVVGCLAPPGPLTAILEQDRVATFACNARHRWDLTAVYRLAAQIRRINPDLVHSTLFHANVAARLVGRLDRPRPIVTGSATIEVERRSHRLGEMLTRSLSDWHVANSHAVAHHLCEDLGFHPSRVVVIPNAVDVDGIQAAQPIDRSAHQIPADRPLLIWAGRMDRVKRIQFLCDALDRVRESSEFSLVLAGDGAERSHWESLVRNRSWSSAARFIGWTSNLSGWLRSADALVLTSLTEGMPNVALEAMAARCCVVASDIPACRELIDPGRTGLLAAGDDPAALAAMIERVLRDKPARAAMADAAFVRICREFAAVKVVRQLSAFYGTVLSAWSI